jgi:hypothetical protein
MTDEERTKMKAAAKVEDLAVDGDLQNLDTIVSNMLASVPNAATVAATDPDELKTLISAIKGGTASNNQSARFLEIVTKLAK